ncbi:MAG: carboxylating nicotinate-nucleotide diphosphorylase [Kineosporiaceae bacterium]
MSDPRGLSLRPWTGEARDRMHAAGLDPDEVRRVVGRALDEDLRDGPDATTAATVPAGARGTATLTARQPGVLAGIVVVAAVLEAALEEAELEVRHPDGAEIVPGTVALTVTGTVRDLLTVERTVLNLTCHLSGIATVTRSWVRAVAGTGCRIRDTRKTLPGLRALQKYAVRCGGGTNHRMSLGDAVLIMDIHVAVAGSVTAAMAAARRTAGHLPMEVEVDTADQLAEAVAAGADLVLLDNWTAEQCAAGVASVRGTGTRLEASGGLTLDTAGEYARTGVDFLAVGALTHSVHALDLGMDV